MSAQSASNVVEIASTQAVEAAWDRYSEMMREALAEPKRLVDRQFFNELTLREDRYKRLFLRWCNQ